MSILNRSTFDTTYANASGTFADNTTRSISEGNLRQFSQDIKDSHLNISDDLKSSPTANEQLSSDSTAPTVFAVGTYWATGQLSSSQILSSNSSPITLISAPGSGFGISLIAVYFFLDWNSIAYATNTTFRLEVNGVAVTSSNTTLLAGVADRYAQLNAIDFDTTTSQDNKALVFEAQTGNPTAGNSPIYFSAIYRIVPLGNLP